MPHPSGDFKPWAGLAELLQQKKSWRWTCSPWQNITSTAACSSFTGSLVVFLPQPSPVIHFLCPIPEVASAEMLWKITLGWKPMQIYVFGFFFFFLCELPLIWRAAFYHSWGVDPGTRAWQRAHTDWPLAGHLAQTLLVCWVPACLKSIWCSPLPGNCHWGRFGVGLFSYGWWFPTSHVCEPFLTGGEAGWQLRVPGAVG